MWVLLSVILILAVLLNISVALKVSFVGGVLDYSVKYGFIRVFSKGKKKTDESSTDKKAEKKKRSEKKDKLNKEEASDDDDKKKSGKKKRKQTLDEKLEKAGAIIDFIKSARKHVAYLLSRIKFSDVDIDFLIAEPDAYDCAIRFGMISAAVYNIIGFVSAHFKTTVKKMNIALKYNNNISSSRYDFGFSVKLRPGTGLIAATGILLAYLFHGRTGSQKEKSQQESEKECINMSDHAVNGLMGITIEKIREMIDVNTIIGNPITTPEGATIIPVSKVSFGFASGGSDLPVKQQKEFFGGAAGAGVSVQPLAFITVSPSGDIKLLQMSVNASKENAIINTIPELIEKISDMVSAKKEEKKAKKNAKQTPEAETVKEEASSEE